ncbi:hypothetical protein DEO45_00180 [Rhodanobacter denitrificans]|uniref:Multi-ubiquitin domain-containing protein n=1 Tax=Rhodanobacter denitrificans TaxID=666685 RepID=A0A368KI30_9GAMM|nr:multiubiquitin domain-containing protein [Rhodanobacter denitrificans]RCS31574.1 hypothetical protein DEO45_00180 [Rhodanobacter denitrificans]
MNTSEHPEIIDIAEYAAADKHPPKGHRYRFFLDKAPYISDQAVLTGREILAFAGLDPQHYDLFKASRGGRRDPIAADQSVDLAEPGTERFFTMKNEHSNGDGQEALAFKLPAEDLAYLRDASLEWEVFLDAEQRWLLIRNWPLPVGLVPGHADIALRIDPNYPMSQIDMAYFLPPLSHAQGWAIPSLATIQVRGQAWQQWSRHRPSNGWRPGIDCLETHLAYVDHFLARAAGGQ